MGRSLLVAVVLLAAALLSLPAAASAASPTVWLCKPGQSSNPCTASLSATVVPASGAVRTERRAVARRAPVDCFYVYPTVSAQDRTNATLRIDPEQRAVARLQASRYSQACRVYAPMYRQLTLRAITVPRGANTAARRLAYRDVRDAWREYLRRHNQGRGVLLVGHSQGTFMLRQLIADEIDGSAPARRRLVGAHLIGGNVTVRRGSDRGGDFERVRACRSARQVGCVVAYSAFGSQPPTDSRFGRVAGPGTDGLEVLCTNPGALGGGAAALDAYVARGAFASLASGSTYWLRLPGRSTARCRRGGGAVWLDVRPRSGRPGTEALFTAVPNAAWGLHVNDMQLALGDLVAVARRQAAAWRARRSRS